MLLNKYLTNNFKAVFKSKIGFIFDFRGLILKVLRFSWDKLVKAKFKYQH